jgi:hypothetical protein
MSMCFVHIAHKSTKMSVWLDYVPSSWGGKPHPAHVVQSETLALVQLPPCEYPLGESLGKQLASGALSNVQAEGVAYACAKHLQKLRTGERAGFYLADSTGMGKGRQLVGIMEDCARRGMTKHIWVSASQDLLKDAERDVRELDSCLKVVKDFGDFEDGILFLTYAELGNRADTLIKKLGADFDGVLAFDECHCAKGFRSVGHTSTKSGSAVVKLQESLPNARVVYASATGIDGMSSMGYMQRMGLWGRGTAFSNFKSFANTSGSQVLALEAVAAQLKSAGAMVSRHLGMGGCEFQPLLLELTEAQRLVYARSSRWWFALRKEYKRYACTYDVQFERRFFRQLITSFKVEGVARAALRDVAEGRCVIIGLQETGESASAESKKNPEQFAEEDEEAMASSCKQNMIHALRRMHNMTGGGGKDHEQVHVESVARAMYPLHLMFQKMNKHLPGLVSRAAEFYKGIRQHENFQWYSRDGSECMGLRMVQRRMLHYAETELDLPGCTLDLLLEKLGGPNSVAEMTGRKSRCVRGLVEKRGGRGHNNRELAAFLSGEKLIAIISHAESVGISMHADARIKNQRRRVHYTLELAQSADRALQQMGRSNRSNQVSAPIYRVVSVDLPAEHRFGQTLIQRLRALGASARADAGSASQEMGLGMVDEDEAAHAIKDMVLSAQRGRLNAVASGKSGDDRALRLSMVNHSRKCGVPNGSCVFPWCSGLSRLIMHHRGNVQCSHESCEHRFEGFDREILLSPGESTNFFAPLPEVGSANAGVTTLMQFFVCMYSMPWEATGRISWYRSDLNHRMEEKFSESSAMFFNTLTSIPPCHQRFVYGVFQEHLARERTLRMRLRKEFGDKDRVYNVVGEPQMLFRDMGTGCSLTMRTLKTERGCTLDEFMRDVIWRVRGDPDAPYPAHAPTFAEFMQTVRGVGRFVLFDGFRGGFIYEMDFYSMIFMPNSQRAEVHEGVNHDRWPTMEETEFAVRTMWEGQPRQEIELGFLTGALFSSWFEIRAAMSSSNRMQTRALQTNEGRIVGVAGALDLIQEIGHNLRREAVDHNLRVEIEGYKIPEYPDMFPLDWKGNVQFLVRVLGFGVNLGDRVSQLGALPPDLMNARLRSIGDSDAQNLLFNYKQLIAKVIRKMGRTAFQRDKGVRLVFMRETSEEDDRRLSAFHERGLDVEQPAALVAVTKRVKLG